MEVEDVRSSFSLSGMYKICNEALDAKKEQEAAATCACIIRIRLMVDPGPLFFPVAY